MEETDVVFVPTVDKNGDAITEEISIHASHVAEVESVDTNDNDGIAGYVIHR